jgi:hypothetical protein
MSTLALRRKARQLWNNPAYQRQWIRSVLRLDKNWLLAEQKQRLSESTR